MTICNCQTKAVADICISIHVLVSYHVDNLHRVDPTATSPTT